MNKILIVDNPVKDPGGKVTRGLCDYLQSRDRSVTVTADLADVPREQLAGFDMAVVPGGDGSIMRAAGSLAPAGVPILGVNLGRIGYLAEIEPDETELIGQILDGKYSIENRMMLAVTVEGETYYALNDAVVSNGAISKMTSLSLFCGDMAVSDYNADGLIVSTPTGSTAYSMSAGGPVIDPSVNCLLVTPVCSHSLTSRPIVFDGGACLRVVNRTPESVGVFLTLDGSKNFRVRDGEQITVKRAPIYTGLIRIKNDGFYTRLGKKMK